MSVAMTNCGEIGWLSDRRGYRYTKIDPLSGKNWLRMADWLKDLAATAAEHVGFPAFNPNVCLINKYTPGTRLGQHIDKDEGDWMSPIVAFSFGLPALFRWGGLQPRDPADDFLVKHGDILVWGGEDRLRYHGIAKIYADGAETDLHERYVMTFRHSRLWQFD